MRRFHYLAWLILFTGIVRAEAPGGLQLGVSGDLVGEFGRSATNRFEPREMELFFYAPVDTLFNAMASAAAHNEEGEFGLEIHELFLGSSSLIPRSRFRLGRFFLGVGRLNQFHRHDWPFVAAPLVHKEYFGDEGLLDSGLEYSYLFPTDFYLDLTLGVTNGWSFTHGHTLGAKPLFPTHYARLVTYFSDIGSSGTQVGTSYIGRRQSDGAYDLYWGVDWTSKWRTGRVLTGLLQSEVWYRKRGRAATSEEYEGYGFYVFPQIALGDQWLFGLRLDGLSRISEKFLGQQVKNFDYAIVPTLSFKPSEFSTIRLAYVYNDGFYGMAVTNRDRMIQLQGLFILGSHPTHEF